MVTMKSQQNLGPPAGIPERYNYDYKVTITYLTKLQQLFALIKETCGITDEQLKDYKRQALEEFEELGLEEF